MVAAAALLVFVVAAFVVAGASVVAGFSVEVAFVVAGSWVAAGSAEDVANVGTSPPALATALVGAASAEEEELGFALQRRSFARFDLRGTTVAGMCATGTASSAMARATTACPWRWLSLLARCGVIMAEADMAMPRRRKARVKCIAVWGRG